MPLIHFNPVVDDKKRAQGQRFQCPVYISADRVEGVTTSLVTKVGLPVDDEAAWVLSGVALLCSLTRMTETKSRRALALIVAFQMMRCRKHGNFGCSRFDC